MHEEGALALAGESGHFVQCVQAKQGRWRLAVARAESQRQEEKERLHSTTRTPAIIIPMAQPYFSWPDCSGVKRISTGLFSGSASSILY